MLTADAVDIREDAHDFIAVTGCMEYRVSKHTGEVYSIRKNGVEQLLAPMKLSLWRPPIDNDRNIKNYWLYNPFRESEMLDRACNQAHDVFRKENVITVIGAVAGIGRSPVMKYSLTLSFYDNGKMQVRLHGEVRKNAHWLARVGGTLSHRGKRDRL